MKKVSGPIDGLEVESHSLPNVFRQAQSYWTGSCRMLKSCALLRGGFEIWKCEHNLYFANAAGIGGHDFGYL